MTEGDVVLAPVPRADGVVKHRPAVILREMPLYGDLLVCGISTQLRLEVPGFDERISSPDADFANSGLKADSLIRLGFLSVLRRTRIIGSIGSILSARRARLLRTLCEYLRR